jgi:thioesterase domain-containing protein
MAARLVQMIRAVQSTGPYRIAGWSFGGTLAYEVAVQLLGRDLEVDLVALIDTGHVQQAPASLAAIPQPKDATEALLSFIATHLEEHDGPHELDALKASLATVAATAATRSYDDLLDECRTLRLIPAAWSAFAQAVPDIFQRGAVYRSALSHYVPQGLPVTIDLFATARSRAVSPSLGWDSVLPAETIRVTPVPGTHHSMVTEPHVRTLGALISSALNGRGRSAGISPDPGESPAILMGGRASDTTKYVLAPGAGSSAAAFAHLASYLDAPAIGLEPRGLTGPSLPHATVEAAAEYYTRALRQAHRPGAVGLIGHSFGGWVVFEMARLLARDGFSIRSLTLLDSEPPLPRQHVEELSNVDAVVVWIEHVELLLDRPLGVTRHDLEARDAVAQRHLLHDRLTNAGILPRRSKPDLLRGLLHTFAAAARAHFEPAAPYVGAVRLILVDDARSDARVNRERHERQIDAWRQWAPNLDHHHCPGNHMTVLKPPYVEAVARLLPSVTA